MLTAALEVPPTAALAVPSEIPDVTQPRSLSASIPVVWDVSFTLSRDGSPHFATVTRSEQVMCRISIAGKLADEDAARAQLLARAEGWIREFLLRPSVG